MTTIIDLGRQMGMELGLRAARKLRPADRHGFPVAPGFIPGVGHIAAMMADLPRVCAEGDKLGLLFWLYMIPGKWVLSTVREEAFAIFRNRDTSSANFVRDGEIVVGQSVLGLDGDPHRRVRGALNAPFTPKGLTANRAGALIAEVIEPGVARWRSRGELPISDETREFAVDVIFRMMGIPSNDLSRWRESFEEYLLSVFPLRWNLPGLPYRRGLNAKRWIDERLLRIIEAARKQDPDSSMVAGMVRGRDEQGRGLSDAELLDNLRILVFAGHETTASTMAWALLYLGFDRLRWRRLVDEALAADRLPSTPEELSRFPFAEGLFREALRLHPPLAFDSRLVIQPFSLLGRTFQPGEEVGLSLHNLSRNAARYPEPDKFIPERWIDRTSGRSKKPGPLEIAQFGGGPHFCLGYHVAWLEAVSFLVCVGRTMGAAGLAPVTVGGALPTAWYMPIQRPPRSARLRFERDLR